MSYYEPWKPKIGDRVQMLRPSECPIDHPYKPELTGVVSEAYDDDADPSYLTKEDLAPGETMEEMIRGNQNYRGHWYWVEYDEAVWLPENRYIVGDFYAALELEFLRS